MTDDEATAQIAPYSVEVGLAPNLKSYQWAIRKNGKIFQRSDRNFSSEAEARKKVMREVERLLGDHA